MLDSTSNSSPRRVTRSRRLALGIGSLLLGIPALTACGFSYGTDRANQIAAGANEKSGDVDVLGAVVVSDTAGSGTFVATLANNDLDEVASLEGISPGVGGGIEPPEFAPISIPPRGLTNLTDEGGIKLTGDIQAGLYTDLVLTFASGETVQISVPIVQNENEYAGLDGPAVELTPETEPGGE